MRLEDTGTDIYNELDMAGRAGATRKELIVRTGFTYWQVGSGLAYVNHHLQESKQQPVVVELVHTGGRGRPQYRYFLPQYWTETTPWLENRLRDIKTRGETELTRLRASQAKWPAEVSPFLIRSTERFVQDIEAIMAML